MMNYWTKVIASSMPIVRLRRSKKHYWLPIGKDWRKAFEKHQRCCFVYGDKSFYGYMQSFGPLGPKGDWTLSFTSSERLPDWLYK